jgi:hypothetical protein
MLVSSEKAYVVSWSKVPPVDLARSLQDMRYMNMMLARWIASRNDSQDSIYKMEEEQ